jgi:hypothetical protein
VTESARIEFRLRASTGQQRLAFFTQIEAVKSPQAR